VFVCVERTGDQSSFARRRIAWRLALIMVLIDSTEDEDDEDEDDEEDSVGRAASTAFPSCVSSCAPTAAAYRAMPPTNSSKHRMASLLPVAATCAPLSSVSRHSRCMSFTVEDASRSPT